ncbi:MAG: magnetochrome domain-containing protein [Mariprofundus sp.]|nr:magnetochrome domain-containing protein [Mariprofundus sp.]
MKTHEWIIGAGVGFSVLAIAVAMFSKGLWQDEDYEDAPTIMAGVPAPHHDGREKMVCASCHRVTIHRRNGLFGGKPKGGGATMAAPTITAGIPAPHRDGRENVDCTACHQVVLPSKGASIGKALAPSPSMAVPPPPIMAGTFSPHRDGRESMICTSCHKVVTGRASPASALSPGPQPWSPAP